MVVTKKSAQDTQNTQWLNGKKTQNGDSERVEN